MLYERARVDIAGYYRNCHCIMAIFNFAALSIGPPPSHDNPPNDSTTMGRGGLDRRRRFPFFPRWLYRAIISCKKLRQCPICVDGTYGHWRKGGTTEFSINIVRLLKVMRGQLMYLNYFFLIDFYNALFIFSLVTIRWNIVERMILRINNFQLTKRM